MTIHQTCPLSGRFAPRRCTLTWGLRAEGALPAVHPSDHSKSRSWIEAGSGVFLLLTLAPGRS
jgi:hypothetical protein